MVFKSEEVLGKIVSYLIIFKIDGKIILKEKYVGDVKYEGIEFIWCKNVILILSIFVCMGFLKLWWLKFVWIVKFLCRYKSIVLNWSFLLNVCL